MIINRHNYEEFFILFIDNELDMEERRHVELFVQQNPDLKEELDLLIQTKLIPEPHIVIEDKNELFRTTENTAITMFNYEEWLILYLDNELTASEKTAVESFITSHPGIKTEFEIFSRARLQPEEGIVFSDKDLLYRRSEKVRFIQMRRWKVAAAILILGIGISTLFILNNRRSSSGPVATHEIKDAGKLTNQSVFQKNSEITKNSSLAENDNKNEILIETLQQQPEKILNPGQENNIPATQKNIPVKLIEPLNKEVPLIADNSLSNNLPSSLNNPNIKINEVTSVPEIAITEIPSQIVAHQPEIPVVTNTSDQPYINTNDVEKSNVNNAGIEDDTNNKSRGLFRKLSRFFERTTKINPANDDDRVLIGVVAVKLR